MRVEGRVGILQRTMVLGHQDWCQGVETFQTKSDCVTDLSLVILQLRNWSCRLLWRYSWFIWNRNVMLNINEFWASQQMLQGSRRALEKHQIFFFDSCILWELGFTSEYAFWWWSLNCSSAKLSVWSERAGSVNQHKLLTGSCHLDPRFRLRTQSMECYSFI